MVGGGAALLAAPEQQAASGPAFPGNSYVVGCGFSHRNNDDPIAFPGQPGRSHNHTYVGNRTVDAESTPASLRGGPSSCYERGDSSAYWTPTLFVGRDPVRPLVGLAYYVKRTTQPLRQFPQGLKMIAGDADATRPQPTSIVSWGCGRLGDPLRGTAVPACRGGQVLQFRIDFPNCWNGTNLDSADHKRHMAYASGGRCPASHPVAVPTLMLIFIYPRVPTGARLASGRYGGHADFINGWDPEALAPLVAALNSVGDRIP
jgi:hypothetical protein